jgi:acyl carrier protein
MTHSQTDIYKQILTAVHELGEDLEITSLQNADDQTALIGSRSDVDSITLVSLIVDVEERLASALNLNVTLADERAMSRRRSPFRTVATLTDYVVELQGQLETSDN